MSDWESIQYDAQIDCAFESAVKDGVDGFLSLHGRAVSPRARQAIANAVENALGATGSHPITVATWQMLASERISLGQFARYLAQLEPFSGEWEEPAAIAREAFEAAAAFDQARDYTCEARVRTVPRSRESRPSSRRSSRRAQRTSRAGPSDSEPGEPEPPGLAPLLLGAFACRNGGAA